MGDFALTPPDDNSPLAEFFRLAEKGRALIAVMEKHGRRYRHYTGIRKDGSECSARKRQANKGWRLLNRKVTSSDIFGRMDLSYISNMLGDVDALWFKYSEDYVNEQIRLYYQEKYSTMKDKAFKKRNGYHKVQVSRFDFHKPSFIKYCVKNGAYIKHDMDYVMRNGIDNLNKIKWNNAIIKLAKIKTQEIIPCNINTLTNYLIKSFEDCVIDDAITESLINERFIISDCDNNGNGIDTSADDHYKDQAHDSIINGKILTRLELSELSDSEIIDIINIFDSINDIESDDITESNNDDYDNEEIPF